MEARFVMNRLVWKGKVNDLSRRQPVSVQKVGQTDDEARQPRHREHEPGKKRSVLLLCSVFRLAMTALDLLVHRENRNLRLEIDLQCGLAGSRRPSRFMITKETQKWLC